MRKISNPTNREKVLWMKSKSVQVGDSWEWTGGMHGVGYGVVPAVFHKSRYAHRAMHEFAISEIPRGMYVLHLCDNRKCINPAHLSVGTHLENIKDMQSKNRQSGGSMPNEKNPFCRFSDKQIAEIREKARIGVKKSKIESEFGIRESHYYRILKNQARTLRNE
jgi:hypothetical protein